jgi:hypothetical protein
MIDARGYRLCQHPSTTIAAIASLDLKLPHLVIMSRLYPRMFPIRSVMLPAFLLSNNPFQGIHILQHLRYMVLLRTAAATGLLGILYTTIRSTNPALLESLSTHITRKMSSSGKGITSWADKDGSFKRQVSAFRDRIEEGGKFAPEKGQLAFA